MSIKASESIYISIQILNEIFNHHFNSSNHGKNFLPRLAALADSAIITEVSQVIDPDTFKRPMYAGNAIATVKMSDAVKVHLFIIHSHPSS